MHGPYERKYFLADVQDAAEVAEDGLLWTADLDRWGNDWEGEDGAEDQGDGVEIRVIFT